MSMTKTNSVATYHLHHGSSKRSHPSVFRTAALPKHGFSSAKQSMHQYSKTTPGRSKLIRMDLNAINDLNSGAPVPSGSPFPAWSNWMLLTILPMTLPFFKSKWGPLLAIKQKLDTAVNTVENIAEAVEEVAEMVDKMADDVAENLPEGSKLKEAIQMLDRVTEDTIKGADLVEELVHKIEEAEERVETLIESEKQKVNEVKATSKSS